jgi:hypothetical protein
VSALAARLGDRGGGVAIGGLELIRRVEDSLGLIAASNEISGPLLSPVTFHQDFGSTSATPGHATSLGRDNVNRVGRGTHSMTCVVGAGAGWETMHLYRVTWLPRERAILVGF